MKMQFKILLSLLLSISPCFAEQTEDEVVADLHAKSANGSLAMKDIPGFNEITIPDSFKKFFDDLSIQNPKMLQNNLGITITGSTEINGAHAEVTATIGIGLPMGWSGDMSGSKTGGGTGTSAGASSSGGKGQSSSTAKQAATAIKTSIGIMLPNTWKFSDMSKSLEAFDLFNFSRIAFALSTYHYFDTGWHVHISHGINVVGTAIFAPDSNVAKIVPGINQLNLKGTVLPASLEGIWPVQLSLASDVTTTDLTVGVVTMPLPSFYIETGLKVGVPKQDNPLLFRAAFNFAEIDCRIEGAMDGMWKNPLGVPGLEIGNLGLEGTISYAGVLTGMGMRGKLGLGKKTVEMAAVAKIGTDSPFGAVALMGELQGGLYLNDLIDVTMQLMSAASNQKISIPKNRLPDIGFENIKVYIVPIPTEIAEKMYMQGLTIAGQMSLGVTKVTVDSHINDTGLKAFGTMKEIDLGPLLITGSGADKQSNTADDGPVVDIQLDGTRQSFYIDGLTKLSIFGITASSEQHIELSNKGFIYHTSVGRAGLTWDLDVTIDWPKFKDVSIVGTVEQNTLDTFAKLLRSAADEIADYANNKDAKALKNTQDKIKELSDEIKKQEKKCEKFDVLACGKVVTLGTERLALKTYEEALLPTMKWTTKATASVVDAIGTLGSNAINLQEMSIDANAKDLTSAKLPAVRIKGVFLGIKFDETMQLDLDNLADGAKKIMDKIAKQF